MRFEAAFAKYVETKYAVAMNSGTAALHAALLAADVGRGDEVIIPSFTSVATAEAVAMARARPVFVDIDEDTYCIDPDEIELAITSRTKAIIPVHLYGLVADMNRIVNIAKDRNLLVIENANQAHGAKQDGKFAGNLGDMGCFSFYGSRNMTTGEGGIVTTNSREFLNVLRTIRNHGESKADRSIMIGHNYRMTEIEAAIGFAQLLKLPKFLEMRRRNANVMSEMLGDVDSLRLSTIPLGNDHSWNVFTLRLLGANASKRNRVVSKIHRRRVDARVYYPTPIHMFQYYQKLFGSYQLSKTETAARQVFSLPVHPGITDSDLARIVRAVKTSL